MIRKFIVPVVALVSAGFTVPMVGCGGGEVKAEVKAPVVEVAPPPPPPPPPPPVVVAPPPPPPPPPPPAAPHATGKIKLRGNQVIIPGELEFNIGKPDLKTNAKTKVLVDEVVAFMKDNPQITKMQVQGHTDNTGNEDANVKLSQARAESVVAVFVAAGIDAGRLDAKGFGSSVDFKLHGKDIPNDNDKHRAMNRRVEIRVLQLGGTDWTVAEPND
jgi:outer membrane protein OmpA-like peptidoglycan-associated protein